MANDRIYMRCKKCGEVLYLGKRYIGEYYWEDYAKVNNKEHKNDPTWEAQTEHPLEERLNDFYTKHFDCTGDWEANCFEIVYESEYEKCGAKMENKDEL